MMHNGKIVNVVDGDTYDCIVELDFNLTIKIRIRLYGVDCPEMDHKNPAGLAAKEFSQKMLIEKSIILNYLKHDSFGRCLCSVWIDNKDFAGILLSEGLAVPYHD